MQMQNWQRAYLKWHPYAPFSGKDITIPYVTGAAAGPLWSTATTQQSPITSGLACLLCLVQNPARAVDGDTTTYATLVLPVGIAATLGQRLNFPGDYLAGDYIALELEVPSQLVSGTLLGGINIETYNNGVSNADQTFLNNNVVTIDLLGLGNGSTNKFRAVFPVTKNFNAVQVNITSALAALGNLRIYEAIAGVPPVVSPANPVVNSGQQASLTASSRLANAEFKWYTTPSGGSPVFTGATFNTPALDSTITYYVETTTTNDNITSYLRTPVTVDVVKGPGPLWSHANTEQSPVTSGLACALCSVDSAAMAIDGDTSTASRLLLPLGIATTLGQRLYFPGNYETGDRIVLDLEVPGQLLSAQLLGGINVVSYKDDVSNNDQIFLNNPLAEVQVLGISTGSTSKFRVSLPVAHDFDAVQVNITSALAALGSLKIYEAVAEIPVTVTPANPHINIGQTAALSASSRLDGTAFRWYTTPTGGSPVFTGANFTTPALNRTTTYYVEGFTPADGLTSYTRIPVTVIARGGPGPIWIYGDEQESPLTGGVACVGCTVTNPLLAADGDTTTASGFVMPVGILGTVGQLVKFPGVYYPGDSIVLIMETPDNILTGQLLPGISVETYNNTIIGPGTPNNDEVRLDASVVRLELLGLGIDNNRKFKVTIPVQDTFDAVRVNLAPAASLSLSEPLKLYEAVAMTPVTVSPSPATVNYNRTATLTPSIRVPDATFNWYVSPTGGAPLATGVLTTPPLTRNATYYVEAVDSSGKRSFHRTAAQVIVAGGNGPLWTFGIEQESPRTGGLACALCTVENPELAVDGDTSTRSRLTMPLGIASTVGQYIRFPAGYQAGDSIVLFLSTEADLLANTSLLSGIQVQTFRGDTSNNDAATLNPALINLQLLGASDGLNHFRITFAATQPFDGTQVDLVSLVGLAGGLYIGEAAAMMPVQVTRVNPTTDSIPAGQSASFTAAIPRIPDATFSWYDTPTGGTPVFSGADFTTPPLLENTTYYVEAYSPSDGLHSLIRTAVPVTVTAVNELACGAATNQAAGTSGVACLGCTVINPQLAVDSDPLTSSELRVGIGLLGGVFQGLGFPSVSGIADTLRVGVSSSSQVLDLGLLTGLSFTLYNGNTQVQQINNPSLLLLRLPNDSSYSELVIAPGVAFDSVKIEFNALLAAISNLRIHYAKVTAPDARVQDSILRACSGGSVTFNAVSPAGATFRWYAEYTGGTPLFTGTTFTATNITSDTTFFVEAVSTGSAACGSNHRTPVAVKLGLPDIAVTPSTIKVSKGQSATFSIVSPKQAYTYRWYAADTGGVALATGTQFITPAIDSASVFYAEADSSGCTSKRTAVYVTISTAPAAPVIIPDTAFVSTGQMATFRIANPDPALTYRWYNTDSGGTVLGTDTLYTTPAVTANGYVYAEAVNASNEVSPRTRAVIRLTDAPGSGPCTYASAQESPVYIGLLNLCLLCGVTDPVNAIDGDTTTFSRITATIGTGSIGQMLHFGETGVAGDSIRLQLGLPSGLADVQLLGAIRVQPYNNGSPSGPAVFLDSQLVRLSLATPTKFVAVLPVQGNYDAVLITLGGLLTAVTALDIYNAEQIILPAKPAADADSLVVCAGSSARIVARDTTGITVQWFDVPTGGAPLFTGGIFNTPALNQPVTTYYIGSSRNGCSNPVRVPVTVRTVTPPAVPQLVNATTSSCAGDTATLAVATPQAGLSYRWYDAPVGGNLVDTGAVLNIVPQSAAPDTLSYYVEAGISDCASSSRAKGDVFVGTNCGGSGGTDTTAITLCAGSSTTLTVDSIITGATYQWYNTANDSLVFTGTSFTTPVLSASVNYLLVSTQNSVRDTIRLYQLTVTSSLATPVLVAPEIVTTTGSAATFTIATPQAGVLYKWYSAASGGTPLDTGSTFTTPALTGDTARYYVEASAGACTSPARAEAIVIASDGGGVPCYTANTTQSPVYTAPISICLLCGVTDPTNAVDGDAATASQVRANIGLGYIGQVLNFQQPGLAGDSIRLTLALPGGLADVQLLGGVRVQTYNGGAPAGSPLFLNGGLGVLKLQLLSGNKFTASFAAPADYDAVYVSIGGVLTALTTMEVFHAEQILKPARPSAATDSLSLCLGASARLVATDTAGVTVKWYASATGGAALFTGGIFNTPALTQPTTTYYIETSRNGCPNPVRVPVTVNARNCGTPGGDTAAITICRGTAATLTVDSVQAGATYEWYNTSNNSLAFTGVNFTTPVLNANTTYRLEAVFAGGFRDTVQVYPITVTDPPVVPVLVNSAVVSCNGGPVQLQVQHPQTGLTYNWYDAPTGGSLVGTGTTLSVTPPAGQDSVKYYAGAAVGSCTSTSRAVATVTTISNLQPPALTVSQQSVNLGETATFTIANPQTGITYRWYSTATGGNPLAVGPSFTAPPLAADSAQYYVEASAGSCVSASRAALTVKKNNNGGNNGDTTDITLCTGSSITLNVVNPQGGTTYRWYNTANNSLVATGTSFTTPVLNASITYLVEGTLQGGAKDTNHVYRITVANNTTPPVVVSSLVKVCSGQDATLIVQNPQPGFTYQWYDAATGGSLVFTGPVYTVAAVTGTRDYYVQSVLNDKCASATRTRVSIQANSTPPAPVVTSANVVTCIGGTATFNIQNPDPAVSYRWYDQPANGTLLAIGTAYTTASLSGTTTFYVEGAFNAGCVSTARTGVTATVVNTLDAPLADAVTVCNGQSAVVTVKNPGAGLIYRWYSTATGGAPLFTGNAYITPPRTANTVYYLEAASGGGCVSVSRTAVNVTVNNVPAAPQVSSADVQVCPGQTATLEVQSPNAGLTYRWYTSPTGGTPVTTGTSVTTSAINTNQQYYVEAVNGSGCASNERTPVSITVGAPNANDIVTDVPDPECPGVVTLTASAPTVTNPVFRWYSTPTGGTQLATGATFTTPSLSQNTTYYVEIATAGGCASTTRKAVTVDVLQPLATPVITVSDSTATSITFRWNSVAGATRYEVSTDNGATFVPPSSGPNGTTHKISELLPNQTVSLVVRALNTNSCQTSQLSAAVTGSATNPAGNQVFIPNMFSPNGDGVNDVFLVYGNTIASLEMHIYNAWGQEVFVTKDQRQGWNGTMNGKIQPSGVYVYIVIAKLQNGTTVNRKGNVTVIR
ncbi:gliding motility-associated C-terminal domain-containing protein [uncultured Chitinophaga sp.]|uniref:Ig-like domain-containing protein n=1 Tax=uncultured Chitinophaga sp. TaxID=339340 RepID=UPI00262DB8C1|nr:gliding motility-associated C-terminal domain-containing protein [uncultured Chitinophaga sp.]